MDLCSINLKDINLSEGDYLLLASFDFKTFFYENFDDKISYGFNPNF